MSYLHSLSLNQGTTNAVWYMPVAIATETGYPRRYRPTVVAPAAKAKCLLLAMLMYACAPWGHTCQLLMLLAYACT